MGLGTQLAAKFGIGRGSDVCYISAGHIITFNSSRMPCSCRLSKNNLRNSAPMIDRIFNWLCDTSRGELGQSFILSIRPAQSQSIKEPTLMLTDDAYIVLLVRVYLYFIAFIYICIGYCLRGGLVRNQLLLREIWVLTQQYLNRSPPPPPGSFKLQLSIQIDTVTTGLF